MLTFKGLVAVGLLVLAATPVHAVVFKIATVSPDGSAWMKLLREAASDITTRTEGRVTFKFYPGGIMGDDKAVLRKIRARQLHGAILTAGGLNQTYTDLQVYTLPMMFNDLAEVDHVRSRMDVLLLEGLRKKGFVGFGIAEVGFAYAMSKAQVSSVAEVRAQKVWIPDGDPGAEQAMSAFAISPIPLPLPDVLGGLQTGLINGVTVPPVLAIILQWHTQVRYVLDLPLMYVYGLLTVSERQYSKLSEADQQLVAQRMGRVVEEVNASSRRDHMQAIAVLKNLGLVWSSLSAQETVEWRALADKASATLVAEGTVSAELVATMNTLLTDYRAGLD